MIINHNMTAMNNSRVLNINGINSGKAAEKLSSGMRINRAADDAAGLAISEKMRGQIRGLNQASKNAQNGISFLQTAEGALDEVSSMLVRIKELQVQEADGTLSGSDKANIKSEITALGSEISNILGAGTQFNGQNVFGATTITVQTGDTAAVSVAISNAAPTVSNGSLELTEKAITDVTTTRANIGALQNRLESTVRNLNVTTENLQSAESRIRDTDMAKTMVDFTKNNILMNAAQAMLAQANQLPQGVLQLLR